MFILLISALFCCAFAANAPTKQPKECTCTNKTNFTSNYIKKRVPENLRHRVEASYDIKTEPVRFENKLDHQFAAALMLFKRVYPKTVSFRGEFDDVEKKKFRIIEEMHSVADSVLSGEFTPDVISGLRCAFKLLVSGEKEYKYPVLNLFTTLVSLQVSLDDTKNRYIPSIIEKDSTSTFNILGDGKEKLSIVVTFEHEESMTEWLLYSHQQAEPVREQMPTIFVGRFNKDGQSKSVRYEFEMAILESKVGDTVKVLTRDENMKWKLLYPRLSGDQRCQELGGRMASRGMITMSTMCVLFRRKSD